MDHKPKTIVSLTSFPAALPYAAKAVRSILAGSAKPDRVVLYLDTPLFPDGVLPAEIEELKAESPVFEVRFTDENIRSYTKLVPALRDFPNDIIVTVDDDIAYHPNLVADLLSVHEKFPEAIIAHRAKRVVVGAPYKRWRKYRWYDFLFRRWHFDHHAMQTGVGGVLYTPHSLDGSMLKRELFMQIAPTNDDVWFWAAAVSKGTWVIPVPFGHNKPHEMGKPDTLSLKTHNLKSQTDFNRVALEGILAKYPDIEKKLTEKR